MDLSGWNPIRAPYTKCPHCSQETFGILMITGKHYIQRCTFCSHDQTIKLPAITKKIIYLDQFVITNLMKAINPDNPSYGRSGLVVWKEVFDRLDRLIKKQVIACPYSVIHEDESLLGDKTIHKMGDSLKKMYKHLSRGNHFLPVESIRQHQIISSFQNYVLTDNPDVTLRQEDVFSHSIHKWDDNISISMDYAAPDGFLDELYQEKDDKYRAIEKVFTNTWKKETHSFDYWYKSELKAHSSVILEHYLNTLVHGYIFEQKGNIHEFYRYISDSRWLIMLHMQDLLENKLHITDVREKNQKITEYFQNHGNSISYFHIESLLWASIAIRSRGEQNPPNPGMVYDITTVSTFLPYCDVMFLDAGIKDLLIRKDAQDGMSNLLRTKKIFTGKIKDIHEFIQYLDEIEQNISEDHQLLLDRLYGTDISAYNTLFIK